ncbi:MAG: hypothetical protein ACREOZ_00580, partial [Gloeomargaritales cyanobacterium]
PSSHPRPHPNSPGQNAIVSPLCNCDVPVAIRRQMSRQPNSWGWHFYKCNVCRYFMWETELARQQIRVDNARLN